ncbi:MAG TPA: hypothetical protein VEU96_20670 [Bryobacteraceae bacterium]|nr:hypothetical protein [Bryobacteraceae bacterium]
MAWYLLGSQCLIDIAKRIDLPPERWLAAAGERGIDGKEIYISAVTPMILASAFERAHQNAALQALRENTEILITRLARSGQVAPVTMDIADRWGKLLKLTLEYIASPGHTKPYHDPERLVLATAIEGLLGRPFVLVEKRQPAHGALASLGLVLEDPYELNA